MGRAIKQRPTFLLGLCGVRSFTSDRIRRAGDAVPQDNAPWNYSLSMVIESMAEQWGTTPSLIQHRELLSMETPSSNPRNRYGDAESIAKWRTIPLCVLDLGCDSTQSIKRYGRQCDGVAMLVLGSLKDARKSLHQFRGDAIPWIGYWTVAFRACSENNSNPETVRKAA